MSENYFRVLFRCVLASFALLVLAATFRLSAWAALIAGVVPLVYYHLHYLLPRARKGLTQTAIDSVYYFGFLITVAALGISAVTIATAGAATDINTVVLQFGVGLIATGYAVIARMHLSSISAVVDEDSPEAILDRYIKRSMDLLDNVEMAVVRTSEFSTTVMANTTKIADTARDCAEAAMLDVAKAFETEMKSTLALARDGLTEIRGLVSDTSFVSEREELARSIKATIEAATHLNKAFGEFAARSREGAQTAQQVTTSTASLGDSLRKLNTDIEHVAGKDGGLLRSAESIREASESIVVGTQAIGKVVGELSVVAGAVSETGPTFQKMRTSAKKSQEQIDALCRVTERFDEALAKISLTAGAAGSLANELGKASEALPRLTGVTQTLTDQLERVAEVSSGLEGQIGNLPQTAIGIQSISDAVAKALGQIVISVESAARHSENLKANTTESARIIDGAQSLLSGATNLHATVGELQKLLEGLKDSFLSTQTIFTESSRAVKDSIATSAETLEADVTRSTQAVTLLTDRLVSVAQTIIDRTRQHQEVVA